MIGVVYETELGFGSIGWLAAVKQDTYSVADPVLGDVEVLPEEVVHIFDPETGSVAGFTAPGVATEQALARVANPRVHVRKLKRPRSIPYAKAERGSVIVVSNDIWDDGSFDPTLPALDAGTYLVLMRDVDGETDLLELNLDTGDTGHSWDPNSYPLTVGPDGGEVMYRLVGSVSENEMAALRKGNPSLIGEAISGYPIAWERVRAWREGAALDWRTVALVGVFCLTTVQRPIETAEQAYRSFGPVLLAALEHGVMPTEGEVERLVRSAHVGGLEKTLARNVVAMLHYAPWLAERLQGSRDYTRGFRNRIALDRIPNGLSLAKLSFLVSILGRDAACIDARLYDSFFKGDREAIRRALKGVEKSKGRISELKLKRYKNLEDRLKRTRFWDSQWPMPYAQAQWRMWESLGEEPAEHDSLWSVVPEPELRRVKNRLLRKDER